MNPGNRKIQKAKPAAFSRPGIELSDPAYKREWVTIRADDVAIGDTVPDFGVVAAVGKTLSASENTTVRLVSAAGKELLVGEFEPVRAFHLVD